jgi:uncharacterized protein YegL
MKISADFSHSKVKFSQENNVNLVISLEAPKVEWQKKRNAIAVLAVLDTSGSMAGLKLSYAKQSICKMIDNLQPGDFCGVVTFDSFVSVVAPPMEMTQSKKDELKIKVGEIRQGGNTNLSGGLMKGIEIGNALDLPDGMIIREIIFTDGQANTGVATKAEEILSLAKASRGRVTISAFGFGTDCDQDMLASLATQSGGSYAYIESPEAALTAFAKELGGLLSTYAQDLVVKISPHNGHRITEVVSDVDVDDDNGSLTVKLDDILSEEKRNLVMRFALNEQKQALPRPVNVADVQVTYSQLEDGKMVVRSLETKAKIQFVKAGEEQDKPDAKIDGMVGLAELAQKQNEAEVLAKAGNFTGAAQVMAMFSADANSRGHSILGNLSHKLRGAYGTSAAYSSSEGYRVSSRGIATRGHKQSGSSNEALADYEVLSSIGGVSLNNTAQDQMVAAFTGSAAPAGNDLSSVAGSLVVPGVDLTPAEPEAKLDEKKAEKKTAAKARSKRW